MRNDFPEPNPSTTRLLGSVPVELQPDVQRIIDREDERLRARNELYDDVRCFRVSPDEAEAEAKRRGLEGFRRHPDPAKFDPMQEVQWPALWALAWSVWKSADRVREYWHEFTAES